MSQYKIHRIGNSLGLVTICLILSLAFYDQVIRADLPCPLCLLQRTAFIGIGLCFCFNLRFGVKTTHYGLLILTALLGFSISLRQIFLHIAPGDPGYGPLFFSLHLYVWSAIIFMMMIGCVAIALFLPQGFSAQSATIQGPLKGLALIFILLILANAISTVIECGSQICPSDPKQYDIQVKTSIKKEII